MSQTALAKVKKGELVNYDKLDLIGEILRLRDSIVNLGDGQILVKKDKIGLIRACKQIVTLSEELNEIQTIQGKTIVTAPGAIRLNQTPSLNIITPLTIRIDGQEKENPYPVKEPANKVIQEVIVKKVVFGAGPTGNMVGVDCTIHFNLFTYLLQDLKNTVMKHPAAGYSGINIGNKQAKSYTIPGKKWIDGKGDRKGYYVPDESKDVIKKTDSGIWNFWVIDTTGLHPVGIWANVAHPEIDKCIKTHIGRQKFAERQAVTIATRNALLAHPAIAVKNVLIDPKTKTVKIPVFGYLHDMTMSEVSKMAEDITTRKTGDMKIISIDEVIDYEDIETLSGESEDIFIKGNEENLNNKTETSPQENTHKSDPAPKDPEREELLNAMWEWRDTKGEDWFIKMREKYRGNNKSKKWPDQYSNEDLKNLITLFKKESKK